LLARTDPLTGAANGRTFYESVATESERAMRTGRPLTLAYLDLDNFKQLNDRLGHAAGDAALIGLVGLIRPALRMLDILARLGGDEFALLLPETDGEGAVALLSRLQGVITREMDQAGLPITLSVGAVTFLKPFWDVDLMVQQVDALMYTAKHRGKNRIEHATVQSAGTVPDGERLRLERRATTRALCGHDARVRPEGVDDAEDGYATVHDLCPDGLGLRMDHRYPEGSLLIVEPLDKQATTLLARVVRITEDRGDWLHGCELPTRLSTDELQCWLNGKAQESQL
jgi:diguanylate cyclase (GGDEF)-like protein